MIRSKKTLEKLEEGEEEGRNDEWGRNDGVVVDEENRWQKGEIRTSGIINNWQEWRLVPGRIEQSGPGKRWKWLG